MSRLTDFQGALAAAYAFVRAKEETQAVANLTLDNLLTDQIARLKGGGGSGNIYDHNGNLIGVRKTQYDELSSLSTQVDAMVKAINEAGSDYAKLEELGLETQPKDSP